VLGRHLRALALTKAMLAHTQVLDVTAPAAEVRGTRLALRLALHSGKLETLRFTRRTAPSAAVALHKFMSREPAHLPADGRVCQRAEPLVRPP